MPVFNTAANTRDAQPVSNFYQGKAIRLALENQRLSNEAQQIQNEQAPQAMEIEQQKADTAQGNLMQRMTENVAKLRDDQFAATENAAAAYEAHLQGNPDDTKGATEAFRTVFNASGFDYGKAVGDPNAELPPEIAGALLAASAKDARSVRTADAKLTPDEKMIRRLPVSRQEQDDLLKKIAEKKGMVVGRSEYDIAADPRTNSQRGAAYQTAVEKNNASELLRENVGASLPRILESPNTVGFRGKATQGISGLLSGIGQDELANVFSEWAADASPEEIAQLQTSLQVVRSQIITLTTGEAGSRISDSEREVADKVVGIIQQIKGPADLTRSYPQVIGAMRQLYEESWASSYVNAKQTDGIEYPYNMFDEDDLVDFIDESKASGIDEETIRRTVLRLQRIQGK